MSDVKIAVLGECMLEISLASATSAGSSLPANLAFGGDVLNTAVYLSRLGCPVDFVTAVGDDKMSYWLLNQWQQEGVGCAQVQRIPDHAPGMYLISTDATGERSFSYWRDQSPARKLFNDSGRAEQIFDQLMRYPWLYLTGISLAILPPEARSRLLRFLEHYRAAGGKVAFDSNYRPRLWGDKADAVRAFEQIYRQVDVALLTLEDEQALFGNGGLQQHQQRLLDYGIPELVIKQGPEGASIIAGELNTIVPAQRVRPVDTTSAGDSFNAGYLAERIGGKDPVASAKTAHRLAALVIQHRGAIIPRRLMAGFDRPEMTG
ncbi:sugar kinase [Simiduia agarivorans]|uniref:2-dehydro-3-deoxygluconokinase n=1 Tax=Simiduia agarivorans (strain DSM 21679 / JCM 13881 / BCRC 17597 / SA1) TaxID=1117647 RepID=K4KZC1_SIMAS|nr:sugar kinase [Simiduia agarivorans]AFU99267.2 ribokinase-like domain-containing protein [Simiduia agarivorans SA1 = DSM 21679]